MSKKNETCGTCWNYSNALGKCMITQCTENPETECEIGMYITKPERKFDEDKSGGADNDGN